MSEQPEKVFDRAVAITAALFLFGSGLGAIASFVPLSYLWFSIIHTTAVLILLVVLCICIKGIIDSLVN